jgi:hypothetical protein
MHEKKSILTQNKILYVKYVDDYLPYDPGVYYFRNRPLYIKTLNSEFKELDMKTPPNVLGESFRLGKTLKVLFFVIKDNKLFEKEWKPESKDFFGSPVFIDPKGYIRFDPMIKNKFLLNNKNN